MNPIEIAPDRWTASRARSAEVARAWRDLPEHAAVADMFAGAAQSDLEVARNRAIALLEDAGWATRLLAPLVATLADDPLFEPPLKANRERGRIGAVLFDAGPVRITASIASAAAIAASPARSVVVPGRVSVTRYVRSGGARLRRWCLEGASVREVASRELAGGDVVVSDGRREGQLIDRAARDVVTLTAILRPCAAATMREYDIASGTLRRSASTDDAASRTAMLLTLLRLSERTDAPEMFDAATRDPAPHARWSAMREWLALDALAALPRLRAMADDSDEEVAAAACMTLAMVDQRRAVACRA